MNIALKTLPKTKQPRERFFEFGLQAMSKTQLLAALLGSGIPGKNVLRIADHIIRTAGKDFLNISFDRLINIAGVGPSRAIKVLSAIELVGRYHEEEQDSSLRQRLSKPLDLIRLVPGLAERRKEYLVCLYLNARNFLISQETVSVGTLNRSLVHPREVFSPAIEYRAASIVIMHNHPSGDHTPSSADESVVRRLKEAAQLLGIHFLDFIIVSKSGYYSYFQQSGLGAKQADYDQELD